MICRYLAATNGTGLEDAGLLEREIFQDLPRQGRRGGKGKTTHDMCTTLPVGASSPTVSPRTSPSASRMQSSPTSNMLTVAGANFHTPKIITQSNTGSPLDSVERAAKLFPLVTVTVSRLHMQCKRQGRSHHDARVKLKLKFD